ncbi:MAG TPA: hypothetical protein VHD15_15455 [Hyphomicrobiales bacterium]|nr:hypothetical protein [Hyphomicrobiales bacterium]
MTMRKILGGLLGVAALGTVAAAATATPAAAQWYHHHYYRPYYYHHYYHPYYRPYYYGPRVVIGAPYYHRCWRAWRTVRVGYHWERRLVRVCR